MKYLISRLLLILSLMATNSTYAMDITVSAAASLTDAFTELASAYESNYPQETVHLNFAGSGALLQQIMHGAPVDVFAPADQWRIEQANKANLLINDTLHYFATNNLVAIVPITDKHNYQSIEQFINADTITHIAISNPEYVPVGRYGQQALQALGLWQQAMTKQIPTQSVRQTLNYVSRGEVDAGLVYQTDANVATDKVRVAAIIPTVEPITYPIAVLKRSEQPAMAQRFVDFVLSEQGQAILQRYGFESVN